MNATACDWGSVMLDGAQPFYHAVVPTMIFANVLAESDYRTRWNGLASQRDRFLLQEDARCCMCREMIYGERAMRAVRILFRMEPTRKYGLAYATLCMRCAPSSVRVTTICSTVGLERAALEWMGTLYPQCATPAGAGPVRWTMRFIEAVNANRVTLMRLMGKARATCAGCSKGDGAKMGRCSGCDYFRYCSRECSVSDWHDGHRTECARLQTARFFYTGRAIRLDK